MLSPKHTRDYTHTGRSDNFPISSHLPFSFHQLLCSFLSGEFAGEDDEDEEADDTNQLQGTRSPESAASFRKAAVLQDSVNRYVQNSIIVLCFIIHYVHVFSVCMEYQNDQLQ